MCAVPHGAAPISFSVQINTTMDLFDKISADIKTAMLAREKVRLETLRGIKKRISRS